MKRNFFFIVYFTFSFISVIKLYRCWNIFLFYQVWVSVIKFTYKNGYSQNVLFILIIWMWNMLFQIILIAADLLKVDAWCGLWSSTAAFIQLFLPLRRWYYENSAPVPASITELIHNPGLLPMEDLVDWYISMKGKIRRKQTYILFSLIFRYYSLHSNHLFSDRGK